MENMIPMPMQKNVDGIAPIAQVRICRGIPWDSSYNHVRLFNSREELFAYVDSKAIYSTDNAAPVKRGYADLPRLSMSCTQTALTISHLKM